jgi:hypothetical protein
MLVVLAFGLFTPLPHWMWLATLDVLLLSHSFFLVFLKRLAHYLGDDPLELQGSRLQAIWSLALFVVTGALLGRLADPAWHLQLILALALLALAIYLYFQLLVGLRSTIILSLLELQSSQQKGDPDPTCPPT